MNRQRRYSGLSVPYTNPPAFSRWLFSIDSNTTIAMAILVTMSLMYNLGVGKRVNIDYWQRLENEIALEHQAHELEQTRDLALEAVNVKASFLATMSHEIRTPMNDILDFSKIGTGCMELDCA